MPLGLVLADIGARIREYPLPQFHMKRVKPSSFLLLISVAFGWMSQAQLYGQAKEYKPEHPTAADAIPEADVITQVLPDRRVTFRSSMLITGYVTVLRTGRWPDFLWEDSKQCTAGSFTPMHFLP
jgi:hypothetical protein